MQAVSIHSRALTWFICSLALLLLLLLSGLKPRLAVDRSVTSRGSTDEMDAL